MEMEKIQYWMGHAVKLAQQAATQDEIPIGCVIVHNGTAISDGMNLREQSHKTTDHAEIVALEKFNLKNHTWRLPENSWVFVTAEPCMMCTGALLWARAQNVVFGCPDPKQAGILRISPWIEQGVFDHRFENVLGGVLEKECAQLLKDYFKAKRVPNSLK